MTQDHLEGDPHFAALTEAYHAVFDLKDSLDDLADANRRYLAYETCHQIAALMHAFGYPVPDRYDGQGRPS